MLFEINKYKIDELNIIKKINLKEIGWKEKDLESYISEHIQELISEDLMPIFTERQWKEEPDILALDKAGNLYIFELKRWESDKENLLQVFRYGQNEKFGRGSYEELNELYKKYRDSDGKDLIEAHSDWFDLKDSLKLDEYSFNKKQTFIILTNGVDFDTIECIKFWKNNGLDIEAMIYNVYEIENKNYIEFNTYSPYGVVPENKGKSIFVLNTNKKYDKNSTLDMIKNKKASAYGSRKTQIERLKIGDIVYLYEKGCGIVAKGIVDTGDIKKADWGENRDDAYYVSLKEFKAFRDNPVKPDFHINPKTLWRISEEDAKILDERIGHK